MEREQHRKPFKVRGYIMLSIQTSYNISVTELSTLHPDVCYHVDLRVQPNSNIRK
jgi:hypothetical protein